jgi:hypothetical protein
LFDVGVRGESVAEAKGGRERETVPEAERERERESVAEAERERERETVAEGERERERYDSKIWSKSGTCCTSTKVQILTRPLY